MEFYIKIQHFLGYKNTALIIIVKCVICSHSQKLKISQKLQDIASM